MQLSNSLNAKPIASKQNYTQLIKTEAKRLGFLSCGIYKDEFLEEEAPDLSNSKSKMLIGK
jgi:epoxyqueuosine reductase